MKKVQSGDPLVIPAQAYNAFIDAAKDFQQRTASFLLSTFSSLLLYCRCAAIGAAGLLPRCLPARRRCAWRGDWPNLEPEEAIRPYVEAFMVPIAFPTPVL